MRTRRVLSSTEHYFWFSQKTEMAMAMAATAAGSRIRSLVPPLCSTNVVRLGSAFAGMSLQTWQKYRHGENLSLSISAVPANVATTPKLVFTISKLKTHKASAKRFRVTASGKIMRRRARKQHLLQKKSTKRKNRLSKQTQVHRSDYDNVIGALPYLKVKGRVA